MEPSKFDRFKDGFWKVATVVVILYVAFLLIVGLYRFGNALTIFLIFGYVTGRISEVCGFNIWLARCLAIPIVILLAYTLREIFSLKKARRKKGIIIGTVIMFVTFLMMFLVNKDVLFNTEGEAVKCYAATPSGYEFVSCDRKVHPVFGTTVHPVNNAIASYFYEKEHGSQEVDRVYPTKDLAFFDPDGNPLIWYYQRPDGKIELFNRPGVHPQFGNVVLSPITSEIAMQIFKYIDDGRMDMLMFSNKNTETSGSSDGSSGSNVKDTNSDELGKLKDLLNSLKK
jgi:hypothetical protein